MTDFEVLKTATRRVVEALKSYERHFQKDGMKFSEKEMAIYIRSEYRRLKALEAQSEAA